MEQLIQFWKLAARLKTEPRRGWVLRLGLQKVESVADHSYAVALLSLFEGERRGYNMERILKLALIHDLAEAITGDVTPWDRRRRGAKLVSQQKRSARNAILARFPIGQREDYKRLWEDLRRGATREARLVRELDGLEMALQASEYGKMGVKRERLMDFYHSARRGIRDQDLRGVMREILASG